MGEFYVENPEGIPSPALLVDPDRVQANIARMISSTGGDASRLRPHVKTYKMAEVVQLQLAAGITKFKAATLAELEMTAAAGAADVLLAYQPVGPNIRRLAAAAERFPNTTLAALVDNRTAATEIAAAFAHSTRPLRLFIDVDCGMHRTGIAWGPELKQLRDTIESLAGVSFGGLHVYDGHLHDASLAARTAAAEAIIETARDYAAPAVIGGGSPTFGIWAAQTPWECSPGTTLLWDVGYGTTYPDLPFEIAAALLTRVISKPGEQRLCLDLGYKAVAAEMPLERRVTIPTIPGMSLTGQSEEHLVITTPAADRYAIGDTFVAYPRHICPTVALHARAHVVRKGVATGETWRVASRDR